MRIVDFLSLERVVPELEAHDKAGALRELAARFGESVRGAAGPVAATDVLRVLAERERLASTGIGEGVAIPHGKLSSLSTLVGCFARSRIGVPFESVDGKPTHLFFALLAPESSTGEHLKALARISRVLKEASLRDRLLDAADAAALHQIITDEDARY